jgi:hypothetical protein
MFGRAWSEAKQSDPNSVLEKTRVKTRVASRIGDGGRLMEHVSQVLGRGRAIEALMIPFLVPEPQRIFPRDNRRIEAP